MGELALELAVRGGGGAQELGPLGRPGTVRTPPIILFSLPQRTGVRIFLPSLGYARGLVGPIFILNLGLCRSRGLSLALSLRLALGGPPLSLSSRSQHAPHRYRTAPRARFTLLFSRSTNDFTKSIPRDSPRCSYNAVVERAAGPRGDPASFAHRGPVGLNHRRLHTIFILWTCTRTEYSRARERARVYSRALIAVVNCCGFAPVETNPPARPSWARR